MLIYIVFILLSFEVEGKFCSDCKTWGDYAGTESICLKLGGLRAVVTEMGVLAVRSGKAERADEFVTQLLFDLADPGVSFGQVAQTLFECEFITSEIISGRYDDEIQGILHPVVADVACIHDAAIKMARAMEQVRHGNQLRLQ